ncbi:uncharacterized protein LOC116023572 [Ipomoea triloba]|uniref:uncharacterized protein LOC116023572 n=1 Tax=Ipomoea triloba TaxID=35885 RepID=UPI00125CE7CD|nr:uncharacterized protein LOC116023572 [Ipomoea triloba]
MTATGTEIVNCRYRMYQLQIQNLKVIYGSGSIMQGLLPSVICEEDPSPQNPTDGLLAVSDRAVSSVLVREEAKGIQKPIYYVSKALQGAELRYTKFEKTALALWVTARRLAAYFQAHPIVVLTDQPLGTILRNPTSSRRLIKWAMMLTQFAIEYKPRPAIKGQALADFIVECTACDPEPDRPTALEEPWWEVSTDGSSSLLPSVICEEDPSPQNPTDGLLAVSDRAVSSVLVREEAKGIQKPIYYVSKALQGAELRYTKFEKTALALWVTARRLAAYFQAHPIVVLTDQPLGTILRNPTSSRRLIKWAMMLTQFAIEYKPRPAIKGQALADFIVECTACDPEPDRPTALEEPWWEVSTDGSSTPEYVSKIARIEEIEAPSIDVIEVRSVEIGEPDWMYDLKTVEIGEPDWMYDLKNYIANEPDWMYDLKNYIANGTLPDDSSRAKKVKLRAPCFQLVDDRLYKRSYGGPLLRCLTSDEAKVVMEEVHEGICSAHQ